MTQEEKRATFLKRAQDNKENFELHRTLFAKYIDEKPDDKLLLGAIAYAEEYHKSKVKNFSSNLPVMQSLPSDGVVEGAAKDYANECYPEKRHTAEVGFLACWKWFRHWRERNVA